MKHILVLISFIQFSAFCGTFVSDTESCPAHELLSHEKSNEILEKVETASQVDVIKQYRLFPEISFMHNNAKISISKRFTRPDKNREHVLGFIKIGETVYPRVFYHSNSHGTFRVIDGVLGEWYSKGPGQAFISIPFNVSKFLLNECIGFGSKRTKKDLEDLLKLSDDHLFYFNNPKVFLSKIKMGIAGPRMDFVFDSNGSSMRNPRDIRLVDGFKPNFSNVITSFKTKVKAAGLVTAYVYKSINKVVEFMIMRGKDSKIWIAEVNTSGSNLNKFGIAEVQYDFGELLQPRWEYPDEIAHGYQSFRRSPFLIKYHSNWNYLREMNIVQDWYKANHLPLPAKEL